MNARTNATMLVMRGASVAMVAALVSGCMGSPTYGTGKRSDVQLLEDVTGMISLGPKEREQIEYRPRPDLVRPADTANLPPPQDNIVTASSQAWPESPEDRRARMRGEATELRDSGNFTPSVRSGRSSAERQPKLNDETPEGWVQYEQTDRASLMSATQQQEFRRRQAMANQGSPEVRRFLSEPPLTYRQPSDAAPVDDLGEDEWRKERRLRQEARKAGTGSSWRDWMPF